jgi:hypothetical protein
MVQQHALKWFAALYMAVEYSLQAIAPCSEQQNSKAMHLSTHLLQQAFQVALVLLQPANLLMLCLQYINIC